MHVATRVEVHYLSFRCTAFLSSIAFVLHGSEV